MIRMLVLTRISHHAVSGIEFGGFGSGSGLLDRFCNGRQSDLPAGADFEGLGANS